MKKGELQLKEMVKSEDIKDKGITKYADIINLPHHVSKKHRQMSLEARAAQFAPFSALTGYEDSIKETVKQVDENIDKNL